MSSCTDFLEVETGVACHLQELGTAHALKQRELQQLVVEWGKSIASQQALGRLVSH
jgi:hypothetical protein